MAYFTGDVPIALNAEPLKTERCFCGFIAPTHRPSTAPWGAMHRCRNRHAACSQHASYTQSAAPAPGSSHWDRCRNHSFHPHANMDATTSWWLAPGFSHKSASAVGGWNGWLKQAVTKGAISTPNARCLSHMINLLIYAQSPAPARVDPWAIMVCRTAGDRCNSCASSLWTSSSRTRFARSTGLVKHPTKY